MSHDPPPEALDRVVRAMAEVEDEMERVGADWAELAAVLVGDAAPDLGGEPLVGLDVFTLLEVLRALPDGAGTGAVLEAFEPPGDATAG